MPAKRIPRRECQACEGCGFSDDTQMSYCAECKGTAVIPPYNWQQEKARRSHKRLPVTDD